MDRDVFRDREVLTAAVIAGHSRSKNGVASLADARQSIYFAKFFFED
jgi:hypothetical protein